MFIKVSHNRLNKSPKCFAEHKNEAVFSVFVLLFKNNFGKVTFSTISTARVGCGGWEAGLAVETEKAKTRKV
jgi:hypothetical protein